jgi:uncharacterized protein YgiM (DUF1202 family)
LILEDEVQGLQLTVSSLESQLSDQKQAFQDKIDNLEREKRLRMQEEAIRSQHDRAKIEALMERLNNARALCRENTKELLRTKKISNGLERKYLEEKAKLTLEYAKMKEHLTAERNRNDETEKVISKKVAKSQEKVFTELKLHCNKLENELQNSRVSQTDAGAARPA